MDVILTSMPMANPRTRLSILADGRFLRFELANRVA